MQVLTLNARHGWRWLFDGFALFRRNPVIFTLLVLSYWLAVALINVVPLIGPIVATIAIPAFSVGLMNASRRLDRGLPLDFSLLFAGFRQHLPQLLLLGALYLLASVVVLGATALSDGGAFLQVMLGAREPTPDEMSGGSFVSAMLIALFLMTPVIMAWWYSPVLVAWHGFTAGKALFFSIAACARNWRPFLAYAACFLLIGGLLPGVLFGFFGLVFPELEAALKTLLTLPLLFILAPTLIASFYVTYREVFVEDGHG